VRKGYITFFTGAGVSAESGIPTFRGKEGLWRRYNPVDLATPEAFFRNPSLVWEFYNERRCNIAEAEPNRAHLLIAEAEKVFPLVSLITQNVDGLHQRAGSRNVIELHGNIWKVKCLSCGKEEMNFETPFNEIPPRCKDCDGLLRPGVVWFGESLPYEALELAYDIAKRSKVFIVVGTSCQVFPAAQLPFIAKEKGAEIIEINPEETPVSEIADMSIRKRATKGMEEVFEYLKEKYLS